MSCTYVLGMNRDPHGRASGVLVAGDVAVGSAFAETAVGNGVEP